MPSLPDIISALNRLSHFSDGQYWKVASHNNTPIGPVVHVDTGLKNTHLWARALPGERSGNGGLRGA